MEKIDIALRMTLGGILSRLIWVLILLIFLASCAPPPCPSCARVVIEITGTSGVSNVTINRKE